MGEQGRGQLAGGTHLRSPSHGGGRGQASLGAPHWLEGAVSLGDLSSLPQCLLSTPRRGAALLHPPLSFPSRASLLSFLPSFPCSSLSPPRTFHPNPPVT